MAQLPILSLIVFAPFVGALMIAVGARPPVPITPPPPGN